MELRVMAHKAGVYGPRIFVKSPVPLPARTVLDNLSSWGGPDKIDDQGADGVWQGWEFPDTRSLGKAVAQIAEL